MGLIDSGSDVLILVLFALRKLEVSAATETIFELVTAAPGTSVITYFDITSALGTLVSTEHLTLTDGMYSITPKGVRNGALLEEDLPASVLQHTEAAASELRRATKRAQLIRTSKTILRRGGYAVELSLSDGRDEVMFLRVTAAGREQAEELEKAFREKAERVFGAVMEELI